jgi:hypothetical protein
LQGLINQVLSMAQASINSRGNPDYWSKPSWDQLKEENYWTEIRKRNTQLAVDKQKGEYTLRDQELANTGQLENTRETNAGELARKQLGIDFNREELEFNKRKFDAENIRDYYKTDVGAQSAKYTGSAELIKAASARANDTTLLPEQRQDAIDFLNNQYSMANKEAKQARPGLVDEQPAPAAAIPAAATPAATKPAFSLNDLTEPVGSTLVNGIAGKNPPTDFNDFKISKPAAPQKTTPSTPATGLGGSIGRGWYGFTHPDEPVPFQGVRSPLRKGLDQTVFTDAPKAVADTARGAVEGVQDFGRNAALGYEQRKAEEEAKKKRKALY